MCMQVLPRVHPPLLKFRLRGWFSGTYYIHAFTLSTSLRLSFACLFPTKNKKYVKLNKCSFVWLYGTRFLLRLVIISFFSLYSYCHLFLFLFCYFIHSCSLYLLFSCTHRANTHTYTFTCVVLYVFWCLLYFAFDISCALFCILCFCSHSR